MTRPTFRVLAAVALSTGLLVASNASAAPVEEESTFFLRSNGCGATQQSGRLSLESGAPDKDTSDGCGVIGGVPLEEVFFQLDNIALPSTGGRAIARLTIGQRDGGEGSDVAQRVRRMSTSRST
jgi:hypothetical protein